MKRFQVVYYYMYHSANHVHRSYLKNCIENNQTVEQEIELDEGEYECLCSTGPPAIVAVVQNDSEKIRLLGSGSGSEESQILRRKRSEDNYEGLGRKERLALQISVDYS